MIAVYSAPLFNVYNFQYTQIFLRNKSFAILIDNYSFNTFIMYDFIYDLKNLTINVMLELFLI